MYTLGEDDMAFVTAADAETITISNDVITMPDSTPSKQLMSGRNVYMCMSSLLLMLSMFLSFNYIIYYENCHYDY
jgi:hypothetical protein